MRRAVWVVAVLALLAGCTGRAPAPARPGATVSGGSFAAGAAGIGDPYFPTSGNGGYDVASYDLALRYDPGPDRLSGRASITASATTDLSRFNLDLSGLGVESVRVNGAVARYTRDGGELVVTAPAGLRRGTQFTVDIGYSGVPKPISGPGLGAEGFLHTADGAVAIGQPEGAASWFPVNDHPLDKATYTIAVTVPAGLTALSNGVPLGSSTVDGWTTWRWAEHAPMASYLATVVIGRYRVSRGSHDGKPVVTAVASSLPVGPADRAMARTTEVADFLATQFGPYPFDAYGGIVHNEPRIRFALENQSRPVYSAAFFGSGADQTWVVAHELAHQWYGDSVSVRHWEDIWLNEGFATYAEWLWSEYTGSGTAEENFRRTYAAATGEVWRVPPGEPGRDELFSRSVYKRGAMTLHALRLTVGDPAFFRILRSWAAQKRDGNATTEEFIALAERESGRSLRALFDAWLFRTTQPPAP
jgi:aminopeptidase N